MTRHISRRAVTAGVAWSVPAVAAAAAAPAFAASSCLSEIDAAFTAAENYVKANYYCNGEPVKLQINLYQPYGALNGFATDIYINVKNLSPCNVTFSQAYPLQLTIDVRNNNVVTTGSRNRDITGVRTSWGGTTGTGESNTIASAPVGSNQGTIQWAFAGRLPGAGLGDNEADLAIGMGDGITGVQRWQSYMTITPGAASGAPVLQSAWAANKTCLDYYNQKLASWVQPFAFYVNGPKIGSAAADGTPITAGTTIETRNIGNYSTGGSASQDGIW